MESRIQDTASAELQGRVGEKLLDDLKAAIQRAEEKAARLAAGETGEPNLAEKAA